MTPADVFTAAVGAFDRGIEVFSPKTAYKRQLNRLALERVRSFNASRPGSSAIRSTISSSSPTTEVATSAAQMMKASRDICRNTSIGKRLAVNWKTHLIGTGIVPIWDSPKAQDLWSEFVPLADASGLHSLYAQQSIAARAWFESGGCLLRFRPRNASDNLPVDFQIELLEMDFLDTQKTMITKSGGFILFGVEFDAIGRRVAYWLFPDHPGEYTAGRRKGFVSKRVPATAVVHLFEADRPGQQLGVPMMHAVMEDIGNAAGFREAELLKQRISACFAGYRRYAGDEPSAHEGNSKKTDLGNPTEMIEPGIIRQLDDNEEITFSEPKISGNFAEFMRANSQSIAAGALSTYEKATGDLSGVNYSSIRAGELDFRAIIEQSRWHTFIPNFCAPVCRRFAEFALSKGFLVAPKVKDYTAPSFPWIDPEKEINAEIKAISFALKSHSESLRERGYDPAIVLKEVIDDMDRLASADLELPLFDVKGSSSAASAGGGSPSGDDESGDNADKKPKDEK